MRRTVWMLFFVVASFACSSQYRLDDSNLREVRSAVASPGERISMTLRLTRLFIEQGDPVETLMADVKLGTGNTNFTKVREGGGFCQSFNCDPYNIPADVGTFTDTVPLTDHLNFAISIVGVVALRVKGTVNLFTGAFTSSDPLEKFGPAPHDPLPNEVCQSDFFGNPMGGSRHWTVCWVIEPLCTTDTVTCLGTLPNCDALGRGTATCTDGVPGPCENVSCGLAWDLVEADPGTSIPLTPTRDLNNFKLNPRWGWQTVDSATAQRFSGDTSQPLEQDRPGLRPFTCGGTIGTDTSGYHINWASEAVTYQGPLFWSEHSWPDDDYNFLIKTPKSHGFPSGVTADNGDIGGELVIKLEFQWTESIGRFGSSPAFDTYWASTLTTAVDNDDPNPAGIDGPDGKSGTEAITIGLMGLDAQHDATSEIHPVWGLALHTNTDPANDTWHFLVRNYGNEGWCSSEQHYLATKDGQPYDVVFQLRRPTTATAPAATTIATNFAGTTHLGLRVDTPSDQAVNDAFITFQMPSPAVDGSLGQYVFGVVSFNWTSAPAPAPRPFAATSLLANQSAPTVPATSADEGEAEAEIEHLLSELTPQQRLTFFSVLPRLAPAVQPADAVSIQATLGTIRPTRASTVPEIASVNDPKQAQRNLDVAKAFCGALNGQLPPEQGSCAKVPPTTVLTTMGGASGLNGWIVSPLTVTLAPVDSTGKGIALTEISFDGTNFTAYTQPFVVPEGIVTLYYRSKDNLGNVESTNQRSFKIDTRAPTSSASTSVQTDHVALSFAVDDPTPGSGAAGLHSISKIGNTNQLETLFTSGQSGVISLNTQCTDIEYWGEDIAGNQESPHRRVADTTPPTLTVAPAAFCMWPPNHRRVRFAMGKEFSASATDACDASPAVKIVSVTSNEPDNAQGDGDTSGDISFGPSSFCVRRERSGGGDGRIYTVILEAADSSGNAARQAITVTVPHSANKKNGCIEAGVEIPDNVPCQ